MSLPPLSSSSASFGLSLCYHPEQFPSSLDGIDPTWRKDKEQHPQPLPLLPFSSLPTMNGVQASVSEVNTVSLKREDSVLPLKSPLPFQLLNHSSISASVSNPITGHTPAIGFNPLFLSRSQSSNNALTPRSIDSYSPHSSSSSCLLSPHQLLQHPSPSSDDQSVTEGEGEGEGEVDDDSHFQFQFQIEHSPDTTNSSASSAFADTPNLEERSSPSPVQFDNSPTLQSMSDITDAADNPGGQPPFAGFSLHSTPQAATSNPSVNTTSNFSFGSSSSSSSFSSSDSVTWSSLSLSSSAADNRAAYLSSAHLSYNFHSIKSLPSVSPVLIAVQVSASRNHKILENKAGTQFMLKEDQKCKRWPRKYLSVWPTVETALHWVSLCLSEWPELRFVLASPDEIRLIVVEDTDAKLHHEVYSLVRNEQEVEMAVRGVRKRRHESRYATAKVRLIHLIPTAICSPNDEGIPIQTLINPTQLMAAGQGQAPVHSGARRRQRNATPPGATQPTATSTVSVSASASLSPSGPSGKRGVQRMKQEGQTDEDEESSETEGVSQPSLARRKKARNGVVSDRVAPTVHPAALSEELHLILAANSDCSPAKIESDAQLHSLASTETQSELSSQQSTDSIEAPAAIVPPLSSIPPLPMDRATSLAAFASPNAFPGSVVSPNSSVPAAASFPTFATVATPMSWSSLASSSSSSELPFSPVSSQSSTHAHPVVVGSRLGAWPHLQFHLAMPSLPAVTPTVANALPILTPHTTQSESRECSMSNGVEDEDIRSFGFVLPLPSSTPTLSQQNSFTNSLASMYQPFQWNTGALDYSFSQGADGERSIYPERPSEQPHSQLPQTIQANADAESNAAQQSHKHEPKPPLGRVPLPEQPKAALAASSACSEACACCGELKETAQASELHSVLLTHSTLSAALIGRFLRESVDDICCVEDLIEFWETAGAARLCAKAALTEIQTAKIASCRRKLLQADAEQLRVMLQQCKISPARQAHLHKCIDAYRSQCFASTAQSPEKKDDSSTPSQSSHLSVRPKSSQKKPSLVHRARALSEPSIAGSVSLSTDSECGSAKFGSVSSVRSRASFDHYPRSVLNGVAAQRRLWLLWAASNAKGRENNLWDEVSRAAELEFVLDTLGHYTASRRSALCHIRSLPLPLRLSLANLDDLDYYQLMLCALKSVHNKQPHTANRTNGTQVQLLVLSVLALNHLSRRWRRGQQRDKQSKQMKDAFSAVVEHCSKQWTASSVEQKDCVDQIWQCLKFEEVCSQAEGIQVAIRISNQSSLVARFSYRHAKS